MWIDDYVRLLFPIAASDLRIEEAQALKYQNLPNTLYKYRSTEDHNLKNLEQGLEWQSYPSEFNDPFDAGLKVSVESIKTELFKERLIDKFQKYFALTATQKNEIFSTDNPVSTFMKMGISQGPKFHEYSEEELYKVADIIDQAFHKEMDRLESEFSSTFSSGYLVSCFSEQKDNRLMWSHYANNHKGYCVGYNFKEQGPKNLLVRILHPTIYNAEKFDATEYYKNIIKTGIGTFNNLYGMYPVISKDDVWAYEMEWRTINPLYGPGISTNDYEKRLLPMPIPEVVYLGARISEEDKNSILAIAQNKKFPVNQMTLDRYGYGLGEALIYKP
ncbi:DUF2971 domain-containing protein [Peribacillus frigoritolerans]|uniref:DUF2971 domain-containing protein n=1 Tax=Peribacillus frigoritolerans TaxID=450367 RepID=UPI00207A44BD|nr:DUF2971 domain-containing protein [Peribacillus frigoritolerans]MEE3953489.1 DUF2971 domain-containing protein [Peribacillus frigoritolerans]USK63459.1 DUF2971 domain-containing protein [Peribacillus frigoritolerans]